MHLHPKPFPDRRSLINPLRAHASDIDLLQGDEIGLACGGHVRDPLRRQLAVRPDTSVYI